MTTLAPTLVVTGADAAIAFSTTNGHDPSPATLGRPGVLLEVTTDEPDRLAAAMVAAGGSLASAGHDGDRSP